MPKNVSSASKAQIFSRLGRLEADTRAYRAAMLRVFSRTMSRPDDCRRYFLDLLVCVSRLYVDYLDVKNDMSALWSLSCSVTEEARPARTHLPEASLRRRFQERMASAPCWSRFDPRTPFAEETGLKTRNDYLDKFALHLPEIYEETLRIEFCARTFRKTLGKQALSDLEVGLEHMGRNHISFVHFALEWAADGLSWND